MTGRVPGCPRLRARVSLDEDKKAKLIRGRNPTRSTAFVVLFLLKVDGHDHLTDARPMPSKKAGPWSPRSQNAKNYAARIAIRPDCTLRVR